VNRDHVPRCPPLSPSFSGPDEDSGALRGATESSLIWLAKGRRKFLLSQHNGGKRRKLTILMNLVATCTGAPF
jgi:hypothetical protein